MNSLTKKIVAIATTVTCAAWMVSPGVASALTAEELQAQIATLTAQLAALQTQLTALTGTTAGTVPAACAGITFTANLAQGSTGAAVKCLQALLNTNAATQVAATGAGSPGAETTYFGALTKAAVAKYQELNAAAILTPLGLTMGTGFVGASTRAQLNSTLASGIPSTPTTPTTPTGGEGSISALAAATPISALTYYAGQIEQSVAGLNLKAVGSDVLVNRLDITFTNVRPWLYIPKITITDGTNVLKVFDVTQANTIEVAVGTSYVVRIEGLNLLVPKDGVKNLVIKFDVTLPVGVATTTTITYAIAGNALRGIDGAGLAQYAPLVTLGNRTLLIARSTVATLEVSAAADNPLARAVIVSETNTTEDVELLRANVKAKFNDAVIRTVIVDFVDANYRLGALKLYDGSTLLAATTTEIGSGAATTTPTASTTFSNLSLRVSKDTTKTLIVKGDILATSTGGYAASVSLPVAATAIIAEDAGDYTTVTTFTGSKAIGNGAYFYPVAPTLALASTEITGITAPSGSPTPQQAQAKIKVNVTANGADIYVPKYGTVASSGIVASSTRTLVYTFTSNATEKTASWLVPAGETKWFEVTAVLDGTSTAGFTNLYLVNFKWGTTEATAATPANTWTWGLTSFKTSDIYLQIKS